MSEEKKDESTSPPPPAGPKIILNEIEKAAEAPKSSEASPEAKPSEPATGADLAAMISAAGKAKPAVESTASVESAPTSEAPSLEDSKAEIPPEGVPLEKFGVQEEPPGRHPPADLANSLITDAMRQLDELLAKFRQPS